MGTKYVSVKKRSLVRPKRGKQPTHNELVKAAHAASGLWSKRSITRAQIKDLRKRLGYV